MTFSLNSDEQNGVAIAVNTILKIAYNVEEGQDWSATADTWWKEKNEDGKTCEELLVDEPSAVVEMALVTLRNEALQAAQSRMGIYVMPTEEDQPPRAAFVAEIAPGVQSAVGGAAYIDGAWRYADGSEVEEELAQAITEHAENLGVEWEH